jgi:hypothetical protein
MAKHNFYFTFGQKYREVCHPTYAKADPNGWVRISSDSYETAREKAFELFGEHFSMQYTEARFEKGYFPKGEIEYFDL